MVFAACYGTSCWGTPCCGQEPPRLGQRIDQPNARVEVQFGIHTSETGAQSWNVGVRITEAESDAYVALSEAEAAISEIAESHIRQLLLSRCLTSEQIGKLRLSAQVDARGIVRRGQAFCKEVEKYPIQAQSSPRLQEKIGRFKKQNAGMLFEPHSMFAKTLDAVARTLPR